MKKWILNGAGGPLCIVAAIVLFALAVRWIDGIFWRSIDSRQQEASEAIWSEAWTAGYLHGVDAERARHGPSDREIWVNILEAQESAKP